MELKIIVHVGSDLEGSKEVVQRLVERNISTKLDQYLNKFNKDDSEGIIEFK
jgi:hypothetical protein